jgi:molecular chaperone GrpE
MSAERKQSEAESPAEAAAETGDEKAPEAVAADGGEAELAEARAKVDENWNLYLRAAAELENVRKRAARDVEHAHKFALENFGRELLAVVDSLEMGLAAADNADAEALREGSEATCKLLKKTLERFGISEVDPEGEPFDPEMHEAMSMMPSPNAEPGSVVQVIQKGYALNDRLLRPARVIVAAEAPQGAGDS